MLQLHYKLEANIVLCTPPHLFDNLSFFADYDYKLLINKWWYIIIGYRLGYPAPYQVNQLHIYQL